MYSMQEYSQPPLYDRGDSGIWVTVGPAGTSVSAGYKGVGITYTQAPKATSWPASTTNNIGQIPIAQAGIGSGITRETLIFALAVGAVAYLIMR